MSGPVFQLLAIATSLSLLGRGFQARQISFSSKIERLKTVGKENRGCATATAVNISSHSKYALSRRTFTYQTKLGQPKIASGTEATKWLSLICCVMLAGVGRAAKTSSARQSDPSQTACTGSA